MRSFDSRDLPEGPRKFLRIGAAAYECKIFLNGKYLGRYQGASTPFFVELTDSLQDGENHLFLCVDNLRPLDRVPMRHADWFNYGGVYRNQVAILRDLDYVKGISPWVLYDFRAERRQNDWQKGWSRKGLIAQDKTTKKSAFHIMQDFYREIASNTGG